MGRRRIRTSAGPSCPRRRRRSACTRWAETIASSSRNGTDAILLRVISPPGTSELVDRSNQASAAKLYDTAPPPQISKEQLARALELDPQAERHARYEPFRDWGHDSLVFPQLSYDSTRGLLLGAYLQRTSYGFGLDPYESRMNLCDIPEPGASRVRSRFPHALAAERPPLRRYSGIEQARFFGFGNDTIRNPVLASNNFYDAGQHQFIVNPVAELALIGGLRARAGFELEYASSVQRNGRLVGQIQPEGAGGMAIGSVQAGLAFDESSGTYPSQRAFSARLMVREAPAIFDNPSAFTKLRGEMTALYGWRLLTNFQLTDHVSGERNWGAYPFFEAASLGGTPSQSPLDVTGATSGNLLRGYDLNRFAGDAAIVSNTDLAIELGRYSAFLPLRHGVWGLFDVGRVFVDGESSSKWHTAAGGGLWFTLAVASPGLDLAASLKLAVVQTGDGTSFLALSGFSF